MNETWVCLLKIKTSDGLRTHVVNKSEFMIGRAQEADIPVLSPGISRMHLMVQVKGDEIWITDQKSANGTTINQHPIEPSHATLIKEGDVIQLGGTAEQFYVEAIPLPFEMMNLTAQHSSLARSMEDMAQEFEKKEKEKIATELQRAREEAQRMLTEARETYERETKKARDEASTLLEQSRENSNAEMDRARKEATHLTDEAKSLYSRESEKAKEEAHRIIEEAKSSAEKAVLHIRNEAEQNLKKSQTAYEQSSQRAKNEAEQIMAQAQREAELLKTQSLLDVQNRKQELEAEIAQMNHDARTQAAQEKMAAQREADRIVTEAQKRIQKDYEEANQQIQSRINSSQAKNLESLQTAETKAREILNSAQAEASTVRLEATEEARRLHQEAVRKSHETVAQLQEKFENEIQEKQESILQRARTEAEREKERILKEAGPQIESLRHQLQDSETRVQKEQQKFDQIKKSIAESEKHKDDLGNKIADLEVELKTAQALVASISDLETKRDQTKIELDRFMDSRDEGLAKIDKELSELREKALLDFQVEKKEQDQELAKRKLKLSEDLKKQITKKEEDYEKTLRLRAMELSHKLHEKFIPQLETWLSDKAAAIHSMRDAIEEAVNHSLLKESTSFQASADVTNPGIHVEREKKKKKNIQIATGVAAVVLVLVGIYWKELYGLMRDSQKDNYANSMLERRRQASLYHPEQTSEYRDTYTDNVLYMAKYFETKTDKKYKESWTLRLNDLDLLRTLGLGEEDIIRFIAKEATLVSRLGNLRTSIDAVYLNEGLQRMRTAEEEDLKEIKKTVGGEANYQKIRSVEQQFLESYFAGQ